MMGNKCNINALKGGFPKNFQPWSSEGEALLTQHGCDLVAIPGKNGMAEHFVGNKIGPSVFVANGFIESVVSYNDDNESWEGDFGKLHAFKKDKIVVTGHNGSGAVLSIDEAIKANKHIKKIVNDD
jgi:hypothetical protein